MDDLPNMSRAAPPRWISFDCYGTLIDWESGVRQVCQELVPMAEEELAELFPIWERVQWEKLHGPYLPYAEILKSSIQETFNILGYTCGGYVLEAFVDSLGRWQPFPDVNPALRQLAQQYRLAIVSNIDRSLLGHSLRHLGVRFAALITAEDARAYKPNPEVFRYALKRLGCPPQEVAHVAFGVDYDLAPASAIGMRVVYVNRKQQPRPDLPLEAEIPSLESLPELWKTESSGRS